jgi:GntR family transcriptional regulator/MocR family aminotransferase
MTHSWSSSSGGKDVHLDWSPGGGRGALAAAIRTAIRDSRWSPGDVVPSTRALAQDLGIARGTVTRVYADLVAEGYLRTSQGAPTRVATAGDRPEAAARRGSQATVPEPRWNLMPGRPSLSMFPAAEWLAAMRRVLQRLPAEVFGYQRPGGVRALHESLARYLARSRGVLADPDRIVVCAGFTQCTALLSQVLLARGEHEIAFEDPSLPQFRRIAEAAGLRLTGVPVDGQGLRVSALDSPAVVVTAAHQYPLGVPLAPSRRTELTRWASRTGGLVVEDDYDGEFRFDHQQVGALQALAPERVVYAGTASKTLAPGLRLAWLVLPRALVPEVHAAVAASGAQPPALDQLVLAELLDSGAYDRHVRRCRAEYRVRRERLLAALPVAPQGLAAGLQLLVRVPDEAAALAACRRASIGLEGLGGHWVSRMDRWGGLVIGYAAPQKHAFAGALEALTGALRDVLP